MESLEAVLDPDTYHSLNMMDTTSRIKALRTMAREMERGEVLTAVQQALVTLILEDRSVRVISTHNINMFK
jgi:hypothetical protein